ncbi:MAG: isoleucine--tRNA ligase, partial [Patescibacteria group bacterium]
MFDPIDPKENLDHKEQEILKFWQKNQTFKKLVKKNQGKQKWSFLDGPITANNPMGVHHAWGRTYKDLFQRFKAMQGYDERFQNGFDCQGLWVEVEVEKELGFKSKKDIENYGIEKFVEKCKERVRKYSKIQTQQSIRLGQWMDWENSYYTMSEENNYAIWHFLKKCHQQKILYKGRDSVPWCPRCSTSISQHEILTEEYQETTHEAIFLKLPIINPEYKETSFLVWTTTPWTIPANVALALNPQFKYAIFQNDQEKLILLTNMGRILDKSFKLKKEISGKELIGLKYQGPFDNLERVKNARTENPATFHQVVAAKELVNPDEGTGIVHIAPGAGTEDFQLAKTEKISVIEVINEEAYYIDGLGEFSGKNAKQDPQIIIDYLKNYQAGQFFYKTENYRHRYPRCWRCQRELVWRVVDEWYISMEKLRQPMMEVAKKINWLPSFGLERELDWLKNMQDWLISKKRYWGLALPIWECDCGNFEVIGSKEELKEKAVSGWREFVDHSPHRPWIDKVKIKCSKCGQVASRIKDVGNPWLDAGIVPYSTLKYFIDKSYWQKWFPADFITESFPGQFKNWFYSLIAMSTVLENSPPFMTVLGFASVRDDKGEEMHKSKGNAIWFDKAAEIMGADCMRWLFLTANPYENLNFGFQKADEVRRRLIVILKNVYSFFATYSKIDGWKTEEIESKDILDQWIKAKLYKIIIESTLALDNFLPNQASTQIELFIIDDLSTWYLRRSRKRRDSQFYSTIYQVLKTISQILAPFMPFIAEEIYQNLKNNQDPESVHLCSWPKATAFNKDIIDKMQQTKDLAEKGLALRAAEGIRLRQPLAKFIIARDLPNNFQEILKAELNVLAIEKGSKIRLDTKITPELKAQGNLRDLIRLIQDLRKIANLSPNQKVELYWQADPNLKGIFEKFKENIEQLTCTVLISQKDTPMDIEKSFNLGDQKIWLGIKK